MPSSVRSGASKSRRSASVGSSGGMRPGFVMVKPVERSTRMIGTCTCKKPTQDDLKHTKPGDVVKQGFSKVLTEEGKLVMDKEKQELYYTYMPCTCFKAASRTYSGEVYGALKKRGGAFWERQLLSAVKEVGDFVAQRLDGPVDDEFRKVFNTGKQMVKPLGPETAKPMDETTVLGADEKQASLVGLLRKMEAKLQDDYIEKNPHLSRMPDKEREKEIAKIPEIQIFPGEKKPEKRQQ